MPYMNESALAYYNGKLQPWIASQPVKTIPSTLYPWTLTDKAGAVTCWPVGGTQLLPTVDFMFTEVPPASGDKGPENPSTISGVSELKVGRVGKNLLLAVPDNTNWYGISITRQADGSYLLNGTSTSSQQRYFPITDCGQLSGGPYSSLKLDVAKTYTLSAKVVSGTIAGGASVSALSTASPSWIPGADMQLESGVTKTATRSAASLVTGEFVCRLNIASGAAFTNVILQVQLEEGDTATDFEAPMLSADANHDIPIGSIYYGGTLDVASGVMTVTWWGLVLDGTEDWISIGSGTYYGYKIIVPQLAPSGSALAPVYNTERCTHFDIQNSVSLSSQHAIVYGNSFAVFTTQNTLASFKQWVADQKTAGHPLSVVYPLAAPFIVQLTPTEILSLTQADKYTPRLNTIYTDASSVQVGYVKSLIREEFELQQAIVSQGGNI